jgi:probable HAF family extracellular repeat protein
VQADFIFTTFDAPGPNTNTWGFGINDAGEIVGEFGPLRNRHGFLLSNGKYTTIQGDFESGAYGINASGQIVGRYSFGAQTHGYLFSDGRYKTLDVPNSILTQANGINASGQIVGYYLSDVAARRAFQLNQNGYTTLELPPLARGADAGGINASGQIVGTYTTAGGNDHGYLLSDGSIQLFPDPPGSQDGTTHFRGINDAGHIVGHHFADGRFHGFLLINGVYTDIDVPGARGTQAWGINNVGKIVGYYIGNDGNAHGFLATPIPEPGTFSLTLIGTLSLLVFVCQRRKQMSRVVYSELLAASGPTDRAPERRIGRN